MGWQKDRAKEVGQLQNYTSDIDAKLKEALEALSSVARGYGAGNDSNHQLNIQRLASNALVKIGQMKQGQKPYIWWSSN